MASIRLAPSSAKRSSPGREVWWPLPLDGNSETVEVVAPSVPTRDDRSENDAYELGQDQRFAIFCDESLDGLRVVVRPAGIGPACP